jgi:CDP-diacylglycerol--glycerol-3-phosphate 3-phosphatidyltransferase
MTLPFWVLYLIAGLTDILDGFLARRWDMESQYGARLDSLADIVFVFTGGYKLFPYLKLPLLHG